MSHGAYTLNVKNKTKATKLNIMTVMEIRVNSLRPAFSISFTARNKLRNSATPVERIAY